MRVLTLDLGMGSLKVCFWRDQKLVARKVMPIATRTEGDLSEQDAGEWWAAASRTIQEMREERREVAETEVIGVTGQMHALIPTDAGGNPLGPVAIVSDRRARHAVAELDRVFGAEAILRTTGGRLDPTTALAKSRFLHNSGNRAWREARYLLPPKDFLRLQLTGEAATDPIDAAGSMLWDINRRCWDRELCDFAGATGKLPDVLPTISLAGRLTAQTAGLLGLTAGIPVATGGGDDIESLGAGALTPGDIFEHLGTTGSVYIATDRLIFDPRSRVETYPDVLPGRYLLGGSTSAAGSALRWVHRLIGETEDWESLDALAERMALQAGPGAVMFLPYLSGERAPIWNDRRSAAFLGLRADHGPETLLQAVLEGVFFSLRHVAESLKALDLVTPESRVHSAGPLGSHAALAQVRSDIYGWEITRADNEDDTTSVASMILAICAVTGENPYALMAKRRHIVRTTAPRPKAHAAYARSFALYEEMAATLARYDTAWGDAP